MTDHPDIVERLMRRTFRPTRDMVQAFEEQGNLTNGDARLHQEAAAEITLLRAEAEALRKAMSSAADLIAATLSCELTASNRGRLNAAHNMLAGTAAIAATKEQQA